MMHKLLNSTTEMSSYQAPDFAIWSVATEQGFAQSVTPDDSDMQGLTPDDAWTL